MANLLPAAVVHCLEGAAVVVVVGGVVEDVVDELVHVFLAHDVVGVKV